MRNVFPGWKTVSFVVLYVLVHLAQDFGFAEWEPPQELVGLTPYLIAAILLILRWLTETPIFNRD